MPSERKARSFNVRPRLGPYVYSQSNASLSRGSWILPSRSLQHRRKYRVGDLRKSWARRRRSQHACISLALLVWAPLCRSNLGIYSTLSLIRIATRSAVSWKAWPLLWEQCCIKTFGAILSIAELTLWQFLTTKAPMANSVSYLLGGSGARFNSRRFVRPEGDFRAAVSKSVAKSCKTLDSTSRFFFRGETDFKDHDLTLPPASSRDLLPVHPTSSLYTRVTSRYARRQWTRFIKSAEVRENLSTSRRKLRKKARSDMKIEKFLWRGCHFAANQPDYIAQVLRNASSVAIHPREALREKLHQIIISYLKSIGIVAHGAHTLEKRLLQRIWMEYRFCPLYRLARKFRILRPAPVSSVNIMNKKWCSQPEGAVPSRCFVNVVSATVLQ